MSPSTRRRRPRRSRPFRRRPSGASRASSAKRPASAQTITIDGVELPYRPACVDWAKGTQGHKHGFHQCWPLKLLNIVVGAVNVPGGILSTMAAGEKPHHWGPKGGTDGMLEDGGHIMPLPHPKAFPGRQPTKPVRMDIGELFPLASHFHPLLPITDEDPAALRSVSTSSKC